MAASRGPEEADRRQRSWPLKRALLLGGALVFVFVAVAITLGNGSREQQHQQEQQESPPVITPSAVESTFTTTAAAADRQEGPVNAVVTPLPPASKANATKAAAATAAATAAGSSTQDALSKLTAAAAAASAAAAGGGSEDKQQGQHEPTNGDDGNPGTCRVQTAEELTNAVEAGPCDFIFLASADREAYLLPREINVTRRVTVVGHPAYLPNVDAGGGGAVRAFHVLAGGYLDLRFVRVRQGVGILRDRYGLEATASALNATRSKVNEIRGGGVAFERGALGGSFLGVTFIAVANTPESVEHAIQATRDGVGGRVYGGHVFVMDGDVQFVACNFWDTTLVLPLTDQIAIGGDILVVGGNCRITGSTFTVSSVFNSFALAGGCAAVLAGSLVVTWSFEQSQSVFTSANGPGQTFWCGGGVLVMTGFDFRLVCAALLFTGMADFAVGGGVMVMSGVDITNAYGLLFAAGAAFYTAVGSGVFVQNAVSYVQFCGPMYNFFSGGSVFVGSGACISTGCPSTFTTSTSAFSGIGSFSYNGAGVSVWVGCPYAYYSATFAFYGNGGTTAQSAGWLTWVGSPAFQPVAIQYFAGAGNVLWEGAGGAVVSGSPVYTPVALSYSNGIPANFVVGHQTFKKGHGSTFAGGKTFASTNANVSRRALPGGGGFGDGAGQTLGPRTRAGKRYLKGQPAVPFPWAASWFGEDDGDDKEVAAAAAVGGVRRSRTASIVMMQTHSFDRVDLAAGSAEREALARWVPEALLDATAAVQALRAELEGRFGGALSSPPGGRQARRRGRHRRHRRRRAQAAAQAQEQPEPEPEPEPGQGQVISRASSSRRDTLFVGEDVAYCGVCDVDSLSGPRAGACETDCAAVRAKAPAVPAAAAAVAASAFDPAQVQFEPTHLVLATLEATVPVAAVGDAIGAAAAATDVRDALRAWLRSPAVDLPDAQVAVFPADAGEWDELVRRWLGEEEGEDVSTGTGTGTGATASGAADRHLVLEGPASCLWRRLRLTAAFVAHDAEAVALLRSVAEGQEGSAEQESDASNEMGQQPTTPMVAESARKALFEAVQGAFSPPTGSEGGEAAEGEAGCGSGAATPSLSFQRTLFIPAYDSPDFLAAEQGGAAFTEASTPTATGINKNSIRLVDPLRPAVPLGAAGMGSHQSLVLGRSYRLELAGFPPRASVLVALVPVPALQETEEDGAATATPEQQPRPLKTLSVDDRGAARMLWTVPRSLPEGQYYLQATTRGEGSVPVGDVGLSQLYTVAARPAPKRKLGPSLEI